MNTTYPKKAAALARDFWHSPRRLGDYLRTLPLWDRAPLDLELPWFSFAAIDFLSQQLRPGHEVFEYGSGGSTLFLAQRTRHVTSVESSPVWYEAVSRRLAERAIGNVSLELHRNGGLQGAAIRDTSFAGRIKAQQWDVVIVDSWCDFNASGTEQNRRALFDLALAHAKPGGVVVLDDSWLYRELLAPRAGWEILDFVSSGPARYGITSTAVFRRLH